MFAREVVLDCSGSHATRVDIRMEAIMFVVELVSQLSRFKEGESYIFLEAGARKGRLVMIIKFYAEKTLSTI